MAQGFVREWIMRGVERFVAPGLSEAARGMDGTVIMLKERLAELELAMEDAGWRAILVNWEREFSRTGLAEIARICRLMLIKNPVIKRSAQVSALYVFGQGVSIMAKDPRVNAVVQKFWDNKANQRVLFSQEALMGIEQALWAEGNLFITFQRDPVDGQYKVSTLPFNEIQEIVTDPDDYMCPWYYKRSYSRVDYTSGGPQISGNITVYYPDWDYCPDEKPDTWGTTQHKIDWDHPVHHLKVGGHRDMKFGVPDAYCMVDWAKAYKEFLEDWATITRALARFAWRYKTDGGDRGIRNARTKLQTTLSSGSEGIAVERNPPPTVAATAVVPSGKELEPVKTSGITTDAEKGRRIFLMAACAAGIPETFYGDASVGTVATATSLDRPTELMFKARQTMYGGLFQRMFNYQIDSAAEAPKSPLAGVKFKDPYQLDSTISNQRTIGNEDPDADDPDDVAEADDPPNDDATVPGDATVTDAAGDVDRHVEASFPPILEHDIAATVTAITTGATLGGYPAAGVMDTKLTTKLLLTAFGVDDIDEVLDGLFGDNYDAMSDREHQTAQPGESPEDGAQPRPSVGAGGLAGARGKGGKAGGGNPNDQSAEKALTGNPEATTTASLESIAREALVKFVGKYGAVAELLHESRAVETGNGVRRP